MSVYFRRLTGVALSAPLTDVFLHAMPNISFCNGLEGGTCACMREVMQLIEDLASPCLGQHRSWSACRRVTYYVSLFHLDGFQLQSCVGM